MRPEDFYTKTRASRGVRVELVDPAGNREWVCVRSSLSAEFVGAVNESWEQIASITQVEPCDMKQKRRERNAKQAASLVAEWSLPSEIDPVYLLIRNPRLRRQIERIAESHALHFGAAE